MIENVDARIDTITTSKAQEGQSLGAGVDGVYNPAPGNEGMAGQYRTPSSPQPQHGRAADNLTMPDEKAKQVCIGDVILEPAGFFQSGFVVYKDGRRVQPTQCLRTIYDALLAQQSAQEKK